MVDQNQSPSPPTPPTTEQTEFTRQTKSEIHEPSHRHAYDAPGLSPREFLLRVMRDKDTPVRTRMKAASELLRLFGNDGFGSPRLTIVIGGIPDQDSVTRDPDGINRNQQPNLSDRSYTLKPFMMTPGKSYIERTIEEIPLSEIMQIVANTPEHLLPTCECGHRMMFPCHPPCSSRRSSLN
jgi:hypothetical protein